VLVDGEPVNSCLMLASNVEGRDITTVEGLEHDGQLHPVQRAFMGEGAVQCGFCTSGMVLTAKALLDRNPDPTEDEIKDALGGNLCRCTGYRSIIRAIQGWRKYADPAAKQTPSHDDLDRHACVGRSLPASTATTR